MSFCGEIAKPVPLRVVPSVEGGLRVTCIFILCLQRKISLTVVIPTGRKARILPPTFVHTVFDSGLF